ncbi:twin-arginine translocase TatA/TatE family subunit [Beijerinckia indica]|uniref:Sec-independent protein translocase protein TatA n=1 Tax=Beijerinckia indica subsp. indica (strain ATCC 9039 / DSM 1715 / NCIMB 8712) TaxID=395963 RepID=TATA_BEII9|nr:twin-arginine translocase TatA/TatE family subunit [Beijerinckia indica]B2IJG4.1 RecName: Full=Sec-independent protein translocase protein TatA [Beijerinckia indica subsp. indica ATCC 9039]ACB96277.1 twin-arginine translocation protein, TatA/E family subunit [Beijerinckia indica subsp. indica ATCC 9039]
MGSLSLWHWIIVGAVLLLLFGGKGKVSDIMGDVAKGIKSFKKGLSEDDEKPEAARPAEPARSLDHQPVAEQPKVSETHRIG